ncbi:Der1-like family-domain-containing protein [Gongronella butleri]|nr:Der1-like family-domain-containing protein [Gongronella butleri]
MPAAQAPSFTQDFKNWYQSLPLVTRTVLATTVVSSALSTFHVLPMGAMVLHWPSVARQFQLWRLVTNFFVGPFKLDMAFNLYLFYMYASKVETELFQHNTADFIYYFIFTGAIQMVLDRFWSNLFFLQRCMMPACMYIWCRHNPQQEVSFMYGFRFKAMYLPWVIVAYEYLTSPPGPGPMPTIFGIVSAHAYHYLKYEYPAAHGGRTYLTTPAFLQRLFPSTTTTWQRPGGRVWANQAAQQPQQQAQQAFSRAGAFGNSLWGRGGGRRLGS